MVFKLGFKVTLARFSQPSKAFCSIVVTLSGKVSSFKPEFWKAELLMVVTV